MVLPENYAEIIKTGMPMFIEVKGYSHVGNSKERLGQKDMPIYGEIIDFAKQIAERTGYEFRDSMEDSRVVLLVRKDVTPEKQKLRLN